MHEQEIERLRAEVLRLERENGYLKQVESWARVFRETALSQCPELSGLISCQRLGVLFDTHVTCGPHKDGVLGADGRAFPEDGE